LEKRSRFLRGTYLDVLAGISILYLLVQLAGFVGLPYHASALGYVACGAMAFMLSASWYASGQTRNKCKGTMVCDCCHALKKGDNQLECGCGGHYLALTEMKWVNANSSEEFSAVKSETHFFTRAMRWKSLRKVT
jgi:hypothetical protein